jgi:hypothetical protein
MEPGSDEHNAGLEAMAKKKGITPSGSVANLQKMDQPNPLRHTEALGGGKGTGIYHEVPAKQKRKGSTGRLQDNNNSFTHS